MRQNKNENEAGESVDTCLELEQRSARVSIRIIR